MTSQPQPVPGEVKSAGQYLRPLRDLAAYALVGAAAVLIFVALVRLIPDGPNQFGYRTQSSFGGFINLVTIGFPLGAVLLSLLVQPRHPKAQLIVVIAVVEYAVMALFGLLFGVLIGLINEASNNGARSALEGLLERVAWIAVFAVAAYAVFQIWRNMFYTPRPKPQSGVYGQPQYSQPGAFQGQPGYGPPPGQPVPGQPGYPPPPPGGGYPQPPQGFAPNVYGQPAPAWNQPVQPIPNPAQPVPPGQFAPHPGSPVSAAPTSAAPATTYPPAGTTYPAAEPTQVVPQDEIDDRTQKLGDERPGFGPADQDPPRQ